MRTEEDDPTIRPASEAAVEGVIPVAGVGRLPAEGAARLGALGAVPLPLRDEGDAVAREGEALHREVETGEGVAGASDVEVP